MIFTQALKRSHPGVIVLGGPPNGGHHWNKGKHGITVKGTVDNLGGQSSENTQALGYAATRP